MSAGRVGRAHGADGSFYVDGVEHPLPRQTPVTVGGRELHVVRRAGTDRRPLVRLSGVDSREEAVELHGEPLLVDGELDEREWLAGDLVGKEVPGLGRVVKVVAGPSCDVLELDDGTLVPFVSDAVKSVGEVIEVDAKFLGL